MTADHWQTQENAEFLRQLENGAFTLPLEAGDNEVAVAIANNFFGWGLMLRLADPEGLHLPPQ
jgi:hypothetical protein